MAGTDRRGSSQWRSGRRNGDDESKDCRSRGQRSESDARIRVRVKRDCSTAADGSIGLSGGSGPSSADLATAVFGGIGPMRARWFGYLGSTVFVCAISVVCFASAGAQNNKVPASTPSIGDSKPSSVTTTTFQSQARKRIRRGQVCEVLGPCGKCDCRAFSSPAK